jgi:hypothetical protein
VILKADTAVRTIAANHDWFLAGRAPGTFVLEAHLTAVKAKAQEII